MPPKKKKPSKNGYWEFVTQYRKNHPNKSTGDVESYCSQKWANMTKSERVPFEIRAQTARNNYQPARRTTDGLDIEAVEKREKDQFLQMQEMKNEISNMLKAATLASNLEDQVFLIIHINHLIYHPSTDRYFICELAIAAVSLKDGVEEVFHKIVFPGKLPLGFYGGALAHSKETHQLLEVVQDEPFFDTTHEVFTEMLLFMRTYGSHQQLPILYSPEKTFEMTNKVIESFRCDFHVREEIKVYNLQSLFHYLRNAAAGSVVWPTDTFSHSAFEKDIYSHTANISCEFHEMHDNSVYCSKSIVTRLGYTICDHCCTDLNIPLVPGFHVPQNAKVATDSRLTSKTPSVCGELNRSAERSRANSISSGNYDENFPALGNMSSNVSVVSFSSMKTVKSGPSSSKAAARIEKSFKNFDTQKLTTHENLNLPEHRTGKKRGN